MVWAIVVAARDDKLGREWRPGTSEQLQIIIDAKRRGQVAPIVSRYYKKTVKKLRDQFAKGFFDTLWVWRMESRV